jgi:hypothetical protein
MVVRGFARESRLATACTGNARHRASVLFKHDERRHAGHLKRRNVKVLEIAELILSRQTASRRGVSLGERKKAYSPVVSVSPG